MNNIFYRRISPKMLSTITNQKIRVVGKVKECTDQ